MKKKTKIILGVVLAAIIILVVVLIVSEKPPEKISNIADCQDLECVKGFAILEGFNPEDCEMAAESFRDGCYHTYVVENTQLSNINIGKYCSQIADENLRADCFYKAAGVLTMTMDIKITMVEAIESLDTEKCNEIGMSEMKERCKIYVELAKEAIEKEDRSLCRPSEGLYIPSLISQTCMGLFQIIKKLHIFKL